MGRLLDSLKKGFRSFDEGMRGDATSLIRKQLDEEESVFALVTMGVFSGLPSPPTGVLLRILPHMSREISVMNKRSAGLDDVFSQTLGTFDID
jgi:hypothetical protein